MDSFTENLLSRARERQRLLKDDDNPRERHLSSGKITQSQPNLNTSPVKVTQNVKNNSESSISRITPTRISSDFTSSKTLNIQKDNFNMEIKVTSADNVRVEVQFEDEDCESGDGRLRKDVRNRLDRLGKLYAGGEDADISSPIHRSEAKFLAGESPKKTESAISKRGLSKLADLAQNFNRFEDDLSSVRKEKNEEVKLKKSKKPPAPQPPQTPPTKPSPEKSSPKKNFNWDRKMMDSLESQGFTRTESSSRLIYKYESEEKENNRSPVVKELHKKAEEVKPISRTPAIADKAAVFESPSNKTKDPALLSVSERKALFEKNKGTPLIPKAAFAMATPPTKDAAPPKPVKEEIVPKVATKEPPKKGGIASKVAALFENKSTIGQEQIEQSIQQQRKNDMELLLNRFHKPLEVVDEEDATEETPMVEEKPAKIVAKERRSSGNKRCSKADSPKVAAVLNEVKRIKVSPQKEGRLYPSLTDIETENETRSPTPNGNSSSSENSFAESSDANTSFGRDILQAVCKGQTPQKNQILEESTSDLSDVLDDMDDYIDEALAYSENQTEGGPTPPKKGRRSKSPIEPSHSFNYKSYSDFNSPLKKPRASLDKKEELPCVVDGDNVLPLTHTVSFYRKQQSQVSTPIRQISRQPTMEELPENAPEEAELVRAKINELKDEVVKQEKIISQTSQALNLCNSTVEFMGSTEQVEAERVLLVATHRRQAAMHERQRLEVEKSLRPKTKNYDLAPQKGTLTISKIVLPLKQKYVTALAAAGGKGHHVVCLIKHGAQVVPTQLVSTVASDSKNPELELAVPGNVTLKEVYNDFTVTFEVYCLQAQEEVLPHEIKYHIKKPNVKLTPKKSKQDSRLVRPIKESPAGPQVVRSPTFALMGYVVFSMPSATNKRHWSLNNTPSMSPLEGTVEMSVSCEMTVSVEHRGFLTMFEDVSGFGAWHRRWCFLKGDILSYWKYPDDEKKMPPINSVDLRQCVTRQVGPVSREICARMHTFLLEIERDARSDDKDSLVTIRRGAKTVIRHLLSADTKEERIDWCNKFNSALSVLQRH